MKNKIIIIFSSHLGEEKNNEFITHIDKTIGFNHKIVCYENYNQYSLSQIYNQAIKEHNEEDSIMIFLHPDIIFRTKNWGKLLTHKFNTSKFSIIGLAGTTELNTHGIWWMDSTGKQMNFPRMYGRVWHTNFIREYESIYSEKIKNIQSVVIIDGVFMAVDCNNIEHIFDEDFKGFHYYDLSMCIPNYLSGCDLGVIDTISILHKSVGETNQQWEQNRLQFIEKYKNELPIQLENY
jgi:hypothetical protein